LISLKPETYNKINCPECDNSEVKINEIIFQGIHVLADCKCSKCKLYFYSDFPSGQALYTPVSFGKSNGKLYDKFKVEWFSKPLYESFKNRSNNEIKIEKKIFRQEKEIIILNCLDYLYGHVLLKLFNSEYYLENCKEYGLILILPKSFEWLLPDGIAEAWLIDLKLSECKNWYISFENFCKNELKRFNKIFLSLAFSHPEPSVINIEKFVKIPPFNLNNFISREINITFITREDRFWVQKKSNGLTKLLKKLFKRFNINCDFKKSKIIGQNKLITKLFKNILTEIPFVKCNVVGLGKSYAFESFINDYRVEKISFETESKWCLLYAESQLVIGIHGSNMLIPTALSGGVIEILPSERLGNILQDISIPHTGRKLSFLCRFIDNFVSPKQISQIAVSIFKDYLSFNLTMNSDFLKHGLYDDVKFWENQRLKNDFEREKLFHE
jgi:hypothetical protein